MSGEKPTPENIQKVADALSGATKNRELAAWSEKEQAINRTEAVIYAEVSRWVGFDVPVGEQIPIVRKGERVGHIASTLLSGNPAQRVAEEARTEGKREIERKIKIFGSIGQGCSDALSSLRDAKMMDRMSLEKAARVYRTPEKGERGRASLEERLIREIGVVDAATIAMFKLLEAIRVELERLEEQHSALSTGKRGRTRNQAAYAVALELALLYAKVTGRKPTYSEGPDGISGEYTPTLRNVFNTLGWNRTTLRGPASAARDAITDDDTRYEVNRLLGLFPAMPRE